MEPFAAVMGVWLVKTWGAFDGFDGVPAVCLRSNECVLRGDVGEREG